MDIGEGEVVKLPPKIRDEWWKGTTREWPLMPELWRGCDRILVLQEGQQAGIVRTADTTHQEVLRLATGTETIPA